MIEIRNLSVKVNIHDDKFTTFSEYTEEVNNKVNVK